MYCGSSTFARFCWHRLDLKLVFVIGVMWIFVWTWWIFGCGHYRCLPVSVFGCIALIFQVTLLSIGFQTFFVGPGWTLMRPVAWLRADVVWLDTFSATP
jgi:hypothetical protein